MPDLTRFDFNAYNFLNSETVEVMTDAEIGQYVLLLVKSWVLAKDASLPDDLELLAKWAHCKRVSDRVLLKFPVVETEFGPRRRNSVLFFEWLRTLERHESAVELGRRGGMSTSINKIAAARENGHLGGRPRNPSETQAGTEAQTKPNQAVPIQTNPNQYDCGNFSNFAVRYRRIFGAKLSRGKITQERYAQACKQFSEDAVLKSFDGWAEVNQWIKEKFETGEMRGDGLRQFYDSLPDLIQEDATFEADKEKEQQIANIRVNAELDAYTLAQKQHAQEEIELAQKRAEEAEVAERIAQNPDALFQ
jgi:hypothetical protein